MKISLNWLQDFIAWTVTDPEEIARRVTAGVAEVEHVEVQGALLDHCCVGKVLYFRKHPNADKLNICDVQTDAGVKRVVCGGTNLRKGVRVAFAHVGATVRWHGTELQMLRRALIRGEESEGMICTAEELDLQSRFPDSRDRILIDLGDSDESVGTSLREFLGLDDVVLHIDNHAITHRADLFSHVGFARECVALGLARWKGGKGGKRGKGDRGELKFPNIPLPLQCIVDRKDLVPRCSSCSLEISGMGETPHWMRKRLEATGWRCVSLPVDITNYVAVETGMPLHSFDADDIRGEFHIRTAKAGETIMTIDGVERVLSEGAIVLSDREGIFDLLGIMGGFRSSTKESTRRVYLHAAIVDPASIRKTIIATEHRTDASTIYEKGVPREASNRGLLRAIELFLELVPGARIVSRLEEWGDDGKPKSITLSLDQMNSVLGTEVPEKRVKKILEDLEFSVKKRRTGTLTITPPLHRLGDIHGAHDLIEEVGRIVGYNDIPAAMPAAALCTPPSDVRVHRLRDTLKADGFTEIVPLSLLSESLLRTCRIDADNAVEIRNPIGEEMKFLQPSTLPGLLEHAQRNLLNAKRCIQTFHLAHIFAKGKLPLRPAPKGFALVRGFEGQAERAELGILFADLERRNGPHALLEEPFLQLKSSLAAAMRAVGYELDVAVAGPVPAYAHPGRFAELLIRSSSSGEESRPFSHIGMIFEMHPTIAAAFDLRHRTAAALVDITTLLEVGHGIRVAAPVPEFPAVSYDYTEKVRQTQSVGDVLKRLRGSHEYLENVAVKDLYSGPEFGKDSYNLTITFTYRAKDRTLTEEEAKEVHAKVLAQLGSS